MSAGETNPGAVTRRDLIKRAAVGGALVWTVPVIDSFSSMAAAGTPACSTFFAVKIDVDPEHGHCPANNSDAIDDVNFSGNLNFICDSVEDFAGGVTINEGAPDRVHSVSCAADGKSIVVVLEPGCHLVTNDEGDYAVCTKCSTTVEPAPVTVEQVVIGTDTHEKLTIKPAAACGRHGISNIQFVFCCES
jgi:hypothetical protein